MKCKKLVITGVLLIFIAAQAFAAVQQYNAAAVKYYKYADAYYKVRNYRYALSYYSAAVKYQRNFWQGWYGIAMSYYGLKKYENAKLSFRYVLQLNPGESVSRKYYDALTKYLSQKKPDAQAFKKRPREKGKGELLWRSMLFPGWGQFESEQYAKGYIFSFGFLLGVGGIVKFTMDQQSAVTAYENANNNFDALYTKAQNATSEVWIPVGITAVIWGLSALDAYMSGVDDNKLKQIQQRYNPTNQYYYKKSEVPGGTPDFAMNIVEIKF